MSGISDGIVTVKMAPPSLMFETETVPLCASTSPLTIDSPRPRPPAGDPSTRKNLSKSRGSEAGGKPGPLSDTLITSPLFSYEASVFMAEPGGVLCRVEQ